MPSNYTENPNRENRMLWGPSPKRVIREFDAWLAGLGLRTRMSFEDTGGFFVAFAVAQERTRLIRGRRKMKRPAVAVA